MGDASLAIVSSTVSPLLPRIMRAASAADALLFGLSLTSYGRNFTGSSLRSAEGERSGGSLLIWPVSFLSGR